MRSILILGAGKSSIALIDYLVEQAAAQQWEVTVADITSENALLKTKGRAHTHAIGFDLNNEQERRALIAKADIVISMLPAVLHMIVAEDCLALKKNLVTPSYISDAMKALDARVQEAGLVFMNEMGLDPGIDHMSAMQLLDELKAKGCTITGFKSHCGGLVAPESDNNPWHYKFTWNPRNVVLAGQGAGGIHYLRNGETVNLKYEDLFASASELEVEGHGKFESYPNRDSLKYIGAYGLEGIGTMYRGTLRVPPFCKGWQCLVKLGLTEEKEHHTNAFLAGKVEMRSYLGIGADSQEAGLLDYLQLSERLQELKQDTFVPSAWLQRILEEKWRMVPGDKDMVVMIHEIEYNEEGQEKRMQSSLVSIGKDAEHTAMAITVGLPVGIITKMILNGEVKRKGVLMPITSDIYSPVLKELVQHGIVFKEQGS
ncbi:MAG: saccharopine dehydrogenase C-terminal domain-containing protein [Chitinophagales bacterium]